MSKERTGALASISTAVGARAAGHRRFVQHERDAVDRRSFDSVRKMRRLIVVDLVHRTDRNVFLSIGNIRGDQPSVRREPLFQIDRTVENEQIRGKFRSSLMKILIDLSFAAQFSSA